MQYYRCKCGKHESIGSMPPRPCRGCEDCGTNLATAPDLHQEPKPHDWQTETVETDDGPKPLTRCSWCGTRRSEHRGGSDAR